MTHLPILLASASPRRRALFEHLGYPFTVTAVDIDETPHPHEAPLDLVTRLAREKAMAAQSHGRHSLIVGADTMVVLGDDILGKPKDKADAVAMLTRLQGNTHTVHTAVALLTPDGEITDVHSATEVTFRHMTPEEITSYVESGEPMDKAGAYGIQERGALFVVKIHGDYFTVVGLPLCHLSTRLTRLLGPAPARS